MVYHVKNPALPQFRFEWHEGTRKVYVMPTPTHEGQRVEATVLAEHADTHAAAIGFVQTWCRGFKTGQASPAKLEVVGG